mmetsp:Transcript_35250/g.81585  ORF Transcript_35250/g.81585 Transcript_35250/m.81585 type:complete len:235 (-) Transcript_35250:1092-1796(-)
MPHTPLTAAQAPLLAPALPPPFPLRPGVTLGSLRPAPQPFPPPPDETPYVQLTSVAQLAGTLPAPVAQSCPPPRWCRESPSASPVLPVQRGALPGPSAPLSIPALVLLAYYSVPQALPDGIVRRRPNGRIPPGTVCSTPPPLDLVWSLPHLPFPPVLAPVRPVHLCAPLQRPWLQSIAPPGLGACLPHLLQMRVTSPPSVVPVVHLTQSADVLSRLLLRSLPPPALLRLPATGP